MRVYKIFPANAGDIALAAAKGKKLHVEKYIQDSNIFKSLANKAIKENQAIAKSGGGFWFGAIVAGAIAYGGYEMFLERYSIEQEYAFISTCVGEQGSS